MKLADILEFAHCQPTAVVHRDIKPQNVLVIDDRKPSSNGDLRVSADLHQAALKIMDFGIGAFPMPDRTYWRKWVDRCSI